MRGDQAATDLGYSVSDVAAAFTAVGVNATCGGTTPQPGSVLQNGVPVSNLTAAKGAS